MRKNLFLILLILPISLIHSDNLDKLYKLTDPNYIIAKSVGPAGITPEARIKIESYLSKIDKQALREMYNDSNRLEAKIYILEELVRRKINIYELVEKDFDIQEKLNVEIGGCLALPSSKEKYRHILLRVYNDQLILSHFDDYGYKSKWNNFNELSELDYWNLPIKYKRYVKYIPYELKWINYYLVYIIIFLSLTVIFLLCKIKYIKIN
jgi:hypothetical protein